MSKFEVAQVNSPILQDLTFLDTPGVLSGEKQRVVRGYDFPAVTQHFAERADRIILLFDCSKLDISDEFEDVVTSLKGNHDKVAIHKAHHTDLPWQISAMDKYLQIGALSVKQSGPSRFTRTVQSVRSIALEFG